MKKNQKPIYFVEERTSGARTHYYVWYLRAGIPVQTLFDVCETREKADAAIELHKRGEHPTQWTPDKQ